MIHIHELGGCAPTPLAHYLKALGILRLVAEQADSTARGWWEGERFRLATTLDDSELASFFLERYQPTPMLAPWNGGSGFFKTWDTKSKKLRKSKNADALHTLLSNESKRLDKFQIAYQRAVNALSNVLKEANVQEMPEKERKNSLIVPNGDGPIFPIADKDGDKAKIQQTMMRFCAENEFYRSAIVDLGEATPAYPSIWGSGGNDGAIDFTARYFENLIEALVQEKESKSKDWFNSSLTNTPAIGLLSGKKGKVGQFFPGAAGGANSIAGPGSQNDTLLNPWDFILMMEGTLVFTAHATRRLGALEQSRAAAPFAVSAHGAGYASAADSDESARGEQWMPLWSQPMTLAELKRLFAEGRAQIGAKSVREPLDLARAVARLGTARGITAFQRYGYIERNGQSNLAVPLGRFHVPTQASPRLACLDDLDAWLPRLRREAHDDQAPARLKQAERALADALFVVTEHPDEPLRWQRVLLTLTAIEEIEVHGVKLRAGPIPKLRPEWVQAADDGQAPMRLALAFALQAAWFGREGLPINAVRRHWIAAKNGETAAVLHARSGIADAIALLERRLIEAGQRGERRLPLVAAYCATAHPTDLAVLLTGEVDLDRTLALARALMALDGRAWAQNPMPPAFFAGPAGGIGYPDDAWLALRLALLPWPIKTPQGGEIRIGADPAVFRRLAGGDAATAVELSLRRLRAAGIQTAVRIAAAPPETARLWAAALAFPVSHTTARYFLRRLDPKAIQEQTR